MYTHSAKLTVIEFMFIKYVYKIFHYILMLICLTDFIVELAIDIILLLQMR